MLSTSEFTSLTEEPQGINHKETFWTISNIVVGNRAQIQVMPECLPFLSLCERYIFIKLFYFCLCVYACITVLHHVHVVIGDQKRVLDLLELEFQGVVSHLWVLESEPGSSERAVNR